MLNRELSLTEEEANALDAILGYINRGANFPIEQLRGPRSVSIRRKLNPEANVSGQVTTPLLKTNAA